MTDYFVMAGATAPSLHFVEELKRRGISTVTLIPSSNGVLVDDATYAEVKERSAIVIEGDDTAEAYTNPISQAIQGGRLVGIAPTVHVAASLAAQLAERFGLRGPSPLAIKRSLDKAVVRRRLAAAGLDNVRFKVTANGRLAEADLMALRYPVVVKPENGYGKFGAGIAASREDLVAHLCWFVAEHAAWQREGGLPASIRPTLLIEEFIAGELFSVECAADDHQVIPLVVVRRKTNPDNPILELGSSIPGTDDQRVAEQLKSYAKSVLEALELRNGLFHVEIILGPDGPALVEVNPRISGGAIPALVLSATGIDLWKILADVTTGLPLGDSGERTASTPMSHSFLGARKAFAAPRSLSPDWFSRLGTQMHSGHCKVQPGSKILQMSGNTTTFGVVRFTGDTVRAAEIRCDEAVSQIAELLSADLWMPFSGEGAAI